MIVKPCDIFFTRNRSILSKVIRWFTRSKGEPKSLASHVGMFVTEGELDDAILVEAHLTVKRWSFKKAYGNKSDAICIYRPLNLTPLEKNIIVKTVNQHEGAIYGFLKLPLHLDDKLFGGRVVLRRLAVSPFEHCTTLIGEGFAKAKRLFGKPPNALSPDDMLDFCQTHKDKYEFVWQRGGMIALD